MNNRAASLTRRYCRMGAGETAGLKERCSIRGAPLICWLLPILPFPRMDLGTNCHPGRRKDCLSLSRGEWELWWSWSKCGESGEILRGSRGASNASSIFLAQCSRNLRAPAEVPYAVLDELAMSVDKSAASRLMSLLCLSKCAYYERTRVCSSGRASASSAWAENVTTRLHTQP